MPTKVWILLAIAGLLLLWSWRRERFGATATIKNPSTWNSAEYARIRALVTPASTLDDTEIQRVLGGFWSYSLSGPLPGDAPIQKGWSVEENRITTADLDAYLTQARRTNLFTEDSKRAKFKELLKAYYIDQGQSEFLAASRYTGPTGPSGGATGATGGTQRRVERPSSSSSGLRQEIATTASIPQNNLTLLTPFVTQVQRFYDTVYLPAMNPPTAGQISGFVDGVDLMTIPEALRSTFKTHLAVILENYFESGPTLTNQGAIAGPTGGAGQQLGSGGATGSGGVGFVSSGSTTTTTPATTAAAAAARRETQGLALYGPNYTSRGSPIERTGGPGGVDGESGQYPTLLGGREPTTYDTTKKNDLPSSASLGSDTGSMYFPFSRTPGDMDILGDPFRALNNFSLASYTPKTDPVPFLPDFSAFQT